MCAVELRTDEQLTGLAIVPDDVRAPVGRLVDELLVGEDPRTVTGLFQRMDEARVRRGDLVCMAAVSALDIGLWDLKAKFNEEPLWKSLGGSRPRVAVHAGSPEPQSSHEALTSWYGLMARSFGCRSGTLKAGLDPKEDFRRLGLLRAALGTDAALAIEAHGTWTAKEAIRHVRALEREIDLTWIEAPARGWDFLANKRVVDAVRAPLCVGAGFGALEALLPHFHNRSINLLKLGAESGGITGALQKADAAFGFELPVVLESSAGNLNAHLAGALPYCMSLEVLDPVSDGERLKTDVSIEGGWARAGDRPGNGLELRRSPGAAA